MNKMKCVVVFLVIFSLIDAQRMGGRRDGRRDGYRNYSGKTPVIIQHRTPAAVSYYDHKDVKQFFFLSFIKK